MSVFDTIEVDIHVELGSTTMPIHKLLRLGRGAVIELDADERQPVRILANNTLVGYGEIRTEDGAIQVEFTKRAYSAGESETS